MEKTDHYVYAVYAGEQQLPCYIGVGRGNRLRAHGNEARSGSHRSGSLRKFRALRACVLRGIPIIERKLYENISKQEAYKIEIRLIKQYGRRDLHTGCLLNASPGGWGGGEWGPAAKDKLRKFRTGIIVSQETRDRLSKAHIGNRHTPETKIKIGLGWKGKKRSPETIAKMKAAQSSPEAIKRKRESSTGRKPSQATKFKMSQSRLKILRNKAGKESKNDRNSTF